MLVIDYYDLKLDGGAKVRMFKCGRLHADLTPKACGDYFAAKRYASCLKCRTGDIHNAVVNEAPRQLDRQLSLIGSACIRCGRNASKSDRSIRGLRLVRDRTLCASCYNRMREVERGVNKKGVEPKKWSKVLRPTKLVVVRDGQQKTIDLGLTVGRIEVERYVERKMIGWRIRAIFFDGVRLSLKKPRIDLTGQRHSHLTAVHPAGKGHWMFRCECGNLKKIFARSVLIGRTKSCGCLRASVRSDDISGQIFGRLLAHERINNKKWMFKCECGVEKPIAKWDVTTGRVNSCGCMRKGLNVKDIVGERFWRMVVVEYVLNGHWMCRCDCGEAQVCRGTDLRKGKVAECVACRKQRRRETTEIYKTSMVEMGVHDDAHLRALMHLKVAGLLSGRAEAPYNALPMHSMWHMIGSPAPKPASTGDDASTDASAMAPTVF
jgi:hypothetical protein